MPRKFESTYWPKTNGIRPNKQALLDPITKEFISKIKDYRVKAGLSREDVEELTGITASTIKSLEKENHGCTIKNLLVLCELYGYDKIKQSFNYMVRRKDRYMEFCHDLQRRRKALKLTSRDLSDALYTTMRAIQVALGAYSIKKQRMPLALMYELDVFLVSREKEAILKSINA